MLEIVYFLFSVVIVSLSGALMPGPVLTVVVRNSPRNHWAGIEAALGHGLIELPLVIAIALGFKHLFASETAQIVIGLIGGAALVYMGIGAVRARPETAVSGKTGGRPRSIAQGLVASINPYFFLWWATAGAAIIMKAVSWSYAVLALMFAAHISVDLAWYGAIGFGLGRTIGADSRLIRPILVFCGIAMISFGIYFFTTSLKLIR
jgi:threonine/homoserine/homoserine lactone efflux protein